METTALCRIWRAYLSLKFKILKMFGLIKECWEKKAKQSKYSFGEDDISAHISITSRLSETASSYIH